MFSHPFYAQVLVLSLLKASFGGFATPGIPLPLVRPSTSFIDDDVLAEFRRSQPIPCQHPRLTATSALTWQPKPSSVTRSEGRIYKQHLSAERPGHDTALAMFSHPFYAQVLVLSLLKASFGGFATPGIPLPLVRPSTSFIDDDVLAEFRRSQPIPCQHPRLTATSALTWQPKPSSVTRSEGRIYKQHLSAERPGHDTALAMFSHPFYAQVLVLSLLKASFGGFATPGIPLPLVRPSTSFIDDDVLAEFRRSQPIPCQHPRLTATSALTWQPKPSSVTRSEGRIYKQHLSAERPGHDTALAMFSHPFYAQRRGCRGKFGQRQ
ncbi:uncharacterized protein [Dermacentor albipictus]|uniref:uncharacterized protein isoform X2 n=1 Tax=Dermacentor albipictus TaxID=60249 RepID=UPI0038FCEDC0